METAIILMNTEIGKEKEVIAELWLIPEVKNVLITYGIYDIVIKIEAEDLDKLKEIVSWSIRRLSNITSTLTLVVEEVA